MYIYKHKMTDIIANERKSHSSIQKMAKSANQNKIVAVPTFPAHLEDDFV